MACERGPRPIRGQPAVPHQSRARYRPGFARIVPTVRSGICLRAIRCIRHACQRGRRGSAWSQHCWPAAAGRHRRMRRRRRRHHRAVPATGGIAPAGDGRWRAVAASRDFRCRSSPATIPLQPVAGARWRHSRRFLVAHGRLRPGIADPCRWRWLQRRFDLAALCSVPYVGVAWARDSDLATGSRSVPERIHCCWSQRSPRLRRGST